MLVFHWAFFGAVLFITLTNAASTHGRDKNFAVGSADQLNLFRTKRSGRGYGRGQTQSQYLNFGKPEHDGKADAEANENGSRSSVSGSHGMGQAQSQFSFGDCTDCSATQVYEYPSAPPDPLTYIGGSNGIDNSNLLRPGPVAGVQAGANSALGSVGVGGGSGHPNSIPQFPSGSIQSGGIIQPDQLSGRSKTNQGQTGLGPAAYTTQLSAPATRGSSPLSGTTGTIGNQPFASGVQMPQPAGPIGSQPFLNGQQGAPRAPVSQFGFPASPGRQPASGAQPSAATGTVTQSFGNGQQGTQYAGSQTPGNQSGAQPSRPTGTVSHSFGNGQQGPPYDVPRAPVSQFGFPALPGSQPASGAQPSAATGTVTQSFGNGQQGTQYAGSQTPGNQSGAQPSRPTGTEGQSLLNGQQGSQYSGSKTPGIQIGNQRGISGAPGSQTFASGPKAPQSTGVNSQTILDGHQGRPQVGGAGVPATQQSNQFAEVGVTGGRPYLTAPPSAQFGGAQQHTQYGAPGDTESQTFGVGQQGHRVYTVEPHQNALPQEAGPFPQYSIGSKPTFGVSNGQTISGSGSGYTQSQPGVWHNNVQGAIMDYPGEYGPVERGNYPGGSGTLDQQGLPGMQPSNLYRPTFSPGSSTRPEADQQKAPGAGQPTGSTGSIISTHIKQGTQQGNEGAIFAPGYGGVWQQGGVDSQHPMVRPMIPSDGSSQKTYGPAPYTPQPGYGQPQPQDSFGQRLLPEPNAFVNSPATLPSAAESRQTYVPGIGIPQGASYTPGSQGSMQQGGTYMTPGTQQGIKATVTPNTGSQQPVYNTGVGSQQNYNIPGLGQTGVYAPGANQIPGTFSLGYGTQQTLYGTSSGSPQSIYVPQGGTQQNIYVPSSDTQAGVYGTGAVRQSAIYSPGEIPYQGSMNGPQTAIGPGIHQGIYRHEVGVERVFQGTSQAPGVITQQTAYSPGIVNQQNGSYRPMTSMQHPGNYAPGNMYDGAIPPEVYMPGIAPQQGGAGSISDNQRTSGTALQDGRFIPDAGRQGIYYGLNSASGIPSGIQLGRDSNQPNLYYGAQPGFPITGFQQGNAYGTGAQTTYPQGPQQAGFLDVNQQTGSDRGTNVILYPGGARTADLAGPTNLVGSTNANSGVAGSDDAFSQAESAITNGQASAGAQGKKNGGTAKTQVSGTYTASGTFSASAMTADSDRSANAQVSGSSEGAMSQSQGQGGAAQSQAQVQVNEKNGGTKASSQSGGIIHQSQSEVQANDKGGLADAQSNGPGQTSSQAQIGFRPRQDGSEVNSSSGGGQASAQSGSHSGQSQSQIQGQSKYGVSYHGAAQSASGTKEQVATYREQNRELFHSIDQFGSNDAVTDRVDTVYGGPALTSESDALPDLQLKASKASKETTSNKLEDDDGSLPEEEDEEDPYDEYGDEEDYYNEKIVKMEQSLNESVSSHSMSAPDAQDNKDDRYSPYDSYTQNSPSQNQKAVVANPSDGFSLVQKQNGRVQRYPPRSTTETVPSGFRGTINIEKKFHTKSLEPHKSHNKVSIEANNEEKNKTELRTPDSYVTVTKSVTGSMDNSKNPPEENKNFQSTYYTKSSTCGYFTFSCNIVYGANGRSKICRPKAPTNGKC